MSAPFPLSPAPAAYAELTGSKRGNVYLAGETPTFSFNKAVTGTWTVRDYYGQTIAAGALPAATSLAVPEPDDGWSLGWYRLYLNGAAVDDLFGTSLGVTNFAIVAPDARFTPRPGRDADMSTGGESPDLALKGWLGIGTSRNQITDVTALSSGGSDNLPGAKANAAISNTYWTTSDAHTGPDPARPRLQYVSMPNDSVDRAYLGDSNSLMLVFASGVAAAAGAVTIATTAGTSSGIKITLTQGSTVEIYDNVPGTVAGAITVLATSALVTGYRSDDRDAASGVSAGATVTLTNTCWAGVVQVVSECYPLGVTWYEGPANEPNIRKNPVRYANDARLFRAAVKAGNPAAKAMGPAVVDITAVDLSSQFDGGTAALYKFLAGVPVNSAAQDGPIRAGRDHLDGLTVHVYNFANGDLNVGRANLENFQAVLVAAGADQLPRFQGEQGVLTCVYGVHHPRRAAWQVMHHLLLDQYGIPMERNCLWYDRSHGFWGFPGWWSNSDQSIEPHAILLHTMAAQTWGRPFKRRLTFGATGRRLFYGSVYTSTLSTAPADRGTTVVVGATSHLDDATVTLHLVAKTGQDLSDSASWLDGFGNPHSVTLVPDESATGSAATVTLPVTAEPTWLRLPVSVDPDTITVDTILGLNRRDPVNLIDRDAFATLNGTDQTPRATNGLWQTRYDGTLDQLTVADLPAQLTIRLAAPSAITHLLVWSAIAWQSHAALVDFDVSTSDDGGTTWTLRETITRATPTSIKHGSTYINTGTQRDTYYDEAWVFPIAFGEPIDADHIRLTVRATSFGGEPDAAAIATGGQGGDPRMCITEVVAFNDAPVQYAIG